MSVAGRAALLFTCLWQFSTCVASPMLAGWFYENLPTSGVSSTRIHKEQQDFTVYHSLWWHNKRFYAVLDDNSAETVLGPAISMNTGILGLPVKDANTFHDNLMAGWVPGLSLLLDLAFPAFPDNMGHWMEALLPVYNILRQGAWKQALPGGRGVIDTVIFVNLRRTDLAGLDWVWEMVKLAVAPALPPGKDIPRILFYDDLDHMDKASWLVLEAALVATDRYGREDGRNGFAEAEFGREFREAAFRLHGLQPPTEGILPRTITLLSAVQGEEVVNMNELLSALQDIGHTLGLAVRPYTATARAPFESYLSVMARTGVLVSRHGPLLANSIFLPPGAVVMELLPYNWEWKGISKIYVNLTRSLGDAHHLAWRATHPKWAVYSNADQARYAEWTPEECNSRDCLEVHAAAAMRVDAARVQEMLMQVIPGAMRGESVEAVRQPWPELARAEGSTGLWWDK
ncbi:hypothetical protein COCOBI_11-4020 [Coccomyxa sp. Obi]|nr:hypothetical protein COCOBI_11-4020 [Coccomyxa sp. Obi]